MYKICKHCKKEIIPSSKAIVVIVEAGDIVMGIHSPEGIFLKDEILSESYYHLECHQLKRERKMVAKDMDQAQKSRAWDRLYEKITKRDLVHLQVDLADIEERMNVLLAQESTKIHILVRGGLVQSIHTDSPDTIQVEVHDFDLFDGATDDDIIRAFGRLVGAEEYEKELERKTDGMYQIY